MNLSKIKITDAQNLLLQFVLSAGGAAVLAFITAVVQYITQHGVYSIATALSVGLAAFLYSFGNSLKNFVPSHVSQEMQALKDAQVQAETLLASIQMQNKSVSQPVVQAPVQPSQTISSPLVVINHPGAQPSAVEVAYNQALATQQAPLQGNVVTVPQMLPQGTAVQNSALSLVIPQPQAAPVVDDFPSNPIMPAVSMPAHLAALTNMSTQPQNVPQVPFPVSDDTLTGVQAARARAGLL